MNHGQIKEIEVAPLKKTYGKHITLPISKTYLVDEITGVADTKPLDNLSFLFVSYFFVSVFHEKQKTHYSIYNGRVPN